MIDVLILTKDEDGSVEAGELSDIEELGELQAIEAQLAELWPKRTSCISPPRWSREAPPVLIWENIWAAPFAAAARRREAS